MSTDAAFATLGVAVGSVPKDITRAFRALTRESHPDTGGDPVRFTEIVNAYRCLQRAGLVRNEPGDTERPAEAKVDPKLIDWVAKRAEPRVESYYRRFLQGLDRVTSQPDEFEVASTRPSRSKRAGSVDVRFAEILDRELMRVS